MQVDLLLSCGCIISVPIKNILEMPKAGMIIRCAICKENKTVSMVGSPYPVVMEEVNENK